VRYAGDLQSLCFAGDAAVFEFQIATADGQARGLTYYRLVDQRPAGDSDSPNGAIERLSGLDAMGVENWERVSVKAEPHTVWDLLNALADVGVTRRPSRDATTVTFAVHEVPRDPAFATPEHLEAFATPEHLEVP
jgi:hypothetical protein